MNIEKLLEEVLAEYNIQVVHQTYAQVIRKFAEKIQNERMEDFIKSIFDADPVKATTLMMITAGKYLADTNAADIQASTECTLNEERYKVHATFTIEKI